MTDLIPFKEKLMAELSFQPTADQLQLIDLWNDFIFKADSNELMLLKGYAGTGKTSMIAALTRVLLKFKIKTILLAPTGRAAKVLSSYSGKKSSTIHRKIYKKFMSPDGSIQFGLSENKAINTIFIVDEASMIGEDRSGREFSGTNLLSDLLEFVYSGDNCKIIFSGDVAQLPPVGAVISPALDPDFLKRNYSFLVRSIELKEVVRQSSESGILFNATSLRIQLLTQPTTFPDLVEFHDVKKITGEELEDALHSNYSTYGEENVLVITRSNKRANIFNQQIRARIKFREEIISAGDLTMVVKNNYKALDEKSSIGFIANGDAIEILKVVSVKEIYGMKFAEVFFKLVDYPDEPEINFMLNLSTLASENPSMTFDEQRQFARLVLEDLGPAATKSQQIAYLRDHPFYNALQVKFSYAVTCHKSQGGQWPCVFIDKGYVTNEMLGEDYYRWLYTALTRATEKIYLVNF